MHIEKEEMRLKDIRKREKDRIRNEEDLKRDLAKIEKAAADAMAAAPFKGQDDDSDGAEDAAAVPAPPPPPPVPNQGARYQQSAPSSLSSFFAPDPAEERDVQKHQIQSMIIQAKRRRVAEEASSSSPAAAPQPAIPVPAFPGSHWLVSTDPNSGHSYYYNTRDGTSSWELPPELANRPAQPAGVDLSRAPPPPSEKKPPPPPARAGKGGVNAPSIGQWQEVKPEESMWHRPEPEAGDPSLRSMDDEEWEAAQANPTTELKAELMTRRGEWAPEDMEVHEKEVLQKRSLQMGNASFPMARKKAAGIRKKASDN